MVKLHQRLLLVFLIIIFLINMCFSTDYDLSRRRRLPTRGIHLTTTGIDIKIVLKGLYDVTIQWGDGSEISYSFDDDNEYKCFIHTYHDNKSHNIFISGQINYLDLSNNGITSIMLGHDTRLYELNLRNNKLSGIWFTSNATTSLRELDLRNNIFTAHDFNALFRQLLYNREKSNIYIGGNPGTRRCDTRQIRDFGWNVHTEVD